MENLNSKEKVKTLTLIELKDIYSKHIKEMSSLEDEYDSDGGKSFKAFNEFKKKKEEFVNDFINELIESKEKFAKIFKTENGSIYFVIKDGESLRFKKQKVVSDTFETKIQPITSKILFISEEDAEKIIKERTLESFGSGDPRAKEEKEIKIVKYGIGTTPLELNLSQDWPDRLEIKEKDGETVSISGFGPYHVGHAIKEIIK